MAPFGRNKCVLCIVKKLNNITCQFIRCLASRRHVRNNCDL